MRLLNTTTLCSRRILRPNLSHTWGNEEITFKEIKKEIRRDKEGYTKLQGLCARAKRDGYKWAWCDTACIDKRSSEELSEAINSMFQWYKNAAIAYAYLAKRISRFVRSFFGEFSIAQRMSWASQRQTTRKEDTAYCLMGLFDVNMPLLYGEGERAFERLQEEKMRSSEKQSLFAWRSFDPFFAGRGLLAGSRESINSSRVSLTQLAGPWNARASNLWFPTSQSHQATNRGIQISLQLQPCSTNTFYVAVLACKERVDQPTSKPGYRAVAPILLRNGENYARVYSHYLLSLLLGSLAGKRVRDTLRINHDIASRQVYIHKGSAAFTVPLVQ
ncbi:hypothetical protein EG328_008597 [Venturia inaequalis]|uniref:Heterokaryon incompatibility domain-containing protein n=1 Tax=Venturia inaequalis TaxID=5025 RepID=A0A8H3UCM0_VENIN|nr:hypothetical protein EG328_008597 [Venturia inaequalis]